MPTITNVANRMLRVTIAVISGLFRSVSASTEMIGRARKRTVGRALVVCKS